MEKIETKSKTGPMVDCTSFNRCGLYKAFPNTEPKEKYRPKFGSADKCSGNCTKYESIDSFVKRIEELEEKYTLGCLDCGAYEGEYNITGAICSELGSEDRRIEVGEICYYGWPEKMEAMK